jgi:hypothetical protein
MKEKSKLVAEQLQKRMNNKIRQLYEEELKKARARFREQALADA